MRCLYCGKKLGLLKRAHGEEFCSPQHHDSYAQQAENALNRLRDSPEKGKQPEPVAAAETPVEAAPAVIAPVIAPSAVAPRRTAPPPEPASLPAPPPPQAPLLQQLYPAQIPPENAKLLPGGPEEIRLTSPRIPALNLVVAAEIPPPPPVPPMGSSVLTLKAISVSAKTTEAVPFEFMIELARPRLAVPPVTETVLSAPEPEVVSEPDIKPAPTEQKPIFEGDFESPWMLADTPPQACDLAVPPQLTPIRMRLMDGGQPQHHPLPVNISALNVDTCFSDAPVSRIRAGVLPHGRPTELVRKPGPPAVQHAATVQISPEADGFFAPAESLHSSTGAVGFAFLKAVAPDLPRPFPQRTVPVVSRPDGFIPIEKNAAGAGLFEKEAGAQVVGPRSIEVSPSEPCASGFNAVGFQDLCPAIDVQREGVETAQHALSAIAAVDGGSSLKEIRLPRKMSCYRTAGLRLRNLEVLPADPLDIEMPMANLSGEAVVLQVSQVGSPPLELDPLTTASWKREISPDPILLSIAPGLFGKAELPPIATPPPAKCRLSSPASAERRSLTVSAIEELQPSLVNLLSLRLAGAAEIPVPANTWLPRIPRRFGVVSFRISGMESTDFSELIQSSGGAAGRFSGCPVLDPDETRALPEGDVFEQTTAIRRHAPSFEWVSSAADLPKYQPFVKFLPARRALEFTRPV